MVWISPRGTLDVLDDYCLWVARDMGYFEQGMDVVMVHGMMVGQVFGFAGWEVMVNPILVELGIDPARRDLVIKFLKGASMGIHFCTANSRAAAQIMYDNLPAVREQMTPELAYQSLNQLAWLNAESHRRGEGYGWSDLLGWEKYLQIIHRLGRTGGKLPVDRVATNRLVAEVNRFDHEHVERDAGRFKLSDTWRAVEPVAGPSS